MYKFKIGTFVNDIMSEYQKNKLALYCKENNIELNICPDDKYSPLTPEDLNDQISLTPLFYIDDLFETITNDKSLSRYFYQDVDSYMFKNKEAVVTRRLTGRDRIYLDNKHNNKYNDIIFFHNAKYNITLGGKVAEIEKGILDIHFYELAEFIQDISILRDWRGRDRDLSNQVTRSLVGAKTSIREYPVIESVSLNLIKYIIKKSHICNEILDFDVVHPKNETEINLLNFNYYRLLDRIR